MTVVTTIKVAVGAAPSTVGIAGFRRRCVRVAGAIAVDFEY